MLTKTINSLRIRDFVVSLTLAGAIILVFSTMSPASASVRRSGLEALQGGRLDVTPAAGTSTASEHAQTVDGQPWSLTAFTNSDGQVCAGELVPNDAGDGGQALTCRDPDSMFAQGPVLAFFGGRVTPKTAGKGWSNSWVWGWVSPAVAAIELQRTDCSLVQLPVSTDHTFLQVFSREQLAAGVGAQRLQALDANGKIIWSMDVILEAPHDADGHTQGSAPSRANC